MEPAQLKKYRVSCPLFTIAVEADERGIILWAAPFARQFVGQPLANLERWAKKLGGTVAVEEL